MKLTNKISMVSFIWILFYVLIIYSSILVFGQSVFNRNDNYDFRDQHYLSAGGTNPDNFNLFIGTDSDFRLFKLHIKKNRLNLGISWLASQYRIDMNNDGIWEQDWTAASELTIPYLYPDPSSDLIANHTIKVEIRYSEVPCCGHTDRIKYIPITIFSTPRVFVDSEDNSFIQLRNEDATTKIPVLLVEGFDPLNDKFPELYYNLTWDLVNLDLYPNGYEVFILNFNNGGRDLRLNADVLLKALEKIHEICPNYKIAVAGLSMGGPITRYALAKREHQGGLHDVGLFLSYDSPQDKAHVSPELQDWIKLQNSNIYAIQTLQDNLKSDAAKQMLWYNTYDPNHTLSDEFYNELNGYNGSGYPQQSYNVAVSNGNLDATWGYGSVGRDIMTLKINNNLIKNVSAVELDCGTGSMVTDITMKRYGDIFNNPFIHVYYELQIIFNPAYIPTWSGLDLLNPQINSITGNITSHDGSKFDDFVMQPTPLEHHELSTVTRNKIMYWLDKDFNIGVNHSLPEGGYINPNNYQVNILHGVPITIQPQNINVNGKQSTFHFTKWQDGNTDNPRTFYTSHNVSHTASMKGTQLSTQTDAYENNSQSKFIRTGDGTLHIVYESLGKVWYEYSTNSGQNWILGNDGKPLNSGNAKLPTIDYYGNSVVIVYQEQYGNNSIIQLKTFNKSGNNFIYGATGTVYTETLDYYSVDANPVIAWGYNGKAIVCWERKTEVFLELYKGIYSQALSLNGTTISLIGSATWLNNTNENSITPTITTDKNYQSINYFNLAWCQNNPVNNTSAIWYYDLSINGSNQVVQRTTNPENPSYNTGYTRNYQPSITHLVQSNGQNAKLVWIGEREMQMEEDKEIEKTNAVGIEKRVLFKSRDGLSWYYTTWAFGNNIQSTSINRSDDGNYVIGWSEQSGSNYSNKYVRNTTLSQVKNFHTTGKDIQLNNGSGFSNMYCNSFQNSALPYSFTISQSVEVIGKENSELAVASGREGVIYNENGSVYFMIGDVVVNNEKIEFVEIDPSIALTSVAEVNNSLWSNNFQLNDASSFTYSVQYGINSEAETSPFNSNEFVSFQVQLIDAQTEEVIGIYDNITYNEANNEPYKNVSYNIITNGIGERSVKLRLLVSTSAEQSYGITTKYADPIVIGKGYRQEILFRGILTINDYSLSQNYPNPFNPVTTISYQLPQEGFVTLKVYDILGREVATLVNEQKSLGRYNIKFSTGSFGDASALSSGVYVYKVDIKGNDGTIFSDIKKMMLLK